MQSKQKRQALVFPKEQKILQQLGENIRLAMKRRKINQTMIAERTGLSKPTLRNIERGESTVSIGHYLRVLAVLGLAEDLSRVALDDEMGRKLQDVELLKSNIRATEPSPRAQKAVKSGSKGANDKQLTPKVNTSRPKSASNNSPNIKSLMALAKSRSNNKS